MKTKYIGFGILALILTSCVVSKKKYDAVQAENAKLKTEVEEMKNPTVDMNNEISKISYYLGMNFANSVKKGGMKSIDSAAVAIAMGDFMNGKKPLVNLTEAQQSLQQYFEVLQNKVIEEQSAAGAKFLAENSMKSDVVTLPSGLQYKIIRAGNGAIPKASEKVKTHYTGTLVDGTVFDSSVKRGTPATFGVTQVIKGWTEALQLMPVGSKWELYIPHFLAYGAQSKGSIPAYSALIFELELLEIVK